MDEGVVRISLREDFAKKTSCPACQLSLLRYNQVSGSPSTIGQVYTCKWDGFISKGAQFGEQRPCKGFQLLEPATSDAATYRVGGTQRVVGESIVCYRRKHAECSCISHSGCLVCVWHGWLLNATRESSLLHPHGHRKSEMQSVSKEGSGAK